MILFHAEGGPRSAIGTQDAVKARFRPWFPAESQIVPMVPSRAAVTLVRLTRCRAKTQQLRRVSRIPPQSQGQTVLYLTHAVVRLTHSQQTHRVLCARIHHSEISGGIPSRHTNLR